MPFSWCSHFLTSHTSGFMAYLSKKREQGNQGQHKQKNCAGKIFSNKV